MSLSFASLTFVGTRIRRHTTGVTSSSSTCSWRESCPGGIGTLEHYEATVAKERNWGSANLRVSTPTEKRAPVITDPIAVNERLVRLDGVVVLGVDDALTGPFRVHVETVS